MTSNSQAIIQDIRADFEKMLEYVTGEEARQAGLLGRLHLPVRDRLGPLVEHHGQRHPVVGGGLESDPLVLQHKRASISLVQRHLRIGYNRAARLLEQMEKSGLVSSMATNGNRDLLVPRRDE